MKRTILILTPVVLLIWACSEKKCPYKPEAIFAKNLPHIVQYNFEKEGPQSLESILLDTKVLLEIYQNVCETTVQEYKFTVQGDFSNYPDSLWLREASRQLVFLSTLSEKQAGLKAWGDIIEQRRSDMRLGEPREVEQGIFVKVDRVISPEKGILLLTFSQDQNAGQ